MSSTTPEERHEVAEKLRAKYHERHSEGWFGVQDLNFQALNELGDLRECLPEGKDVFKELADLIEPTCRIVETIEDGRTMYVCSNCGNCKSEDKELLSLFDYCPHCGSRVVILSEQN